MLLLGLYAPLPGQDVPRGSAGDGPPAEDYLDSLQLRSLPDLPSSIEESQPERPEREARPWRPPFARQGRELRRMIGRAHARDLHEDVYWLRLMHYRPTVTGGFTSEADGGNFFLHERGKYDPRLELHANLEGFLKPKLPDGSDLRCIFPLRYKWLRGQLGNPKIYPEVKCPGVKQYLDSVSADSVSLVFASYFLSSPASMFGHTLIKLNSKKRGGMELLDWIINFGAHTGRSSGVIDIWKGLTGGYPGRIATVPYHIKVREYNDVESRDIWEYQLNLTPDEIENMLLHTVELEQTHFDYYYFDENCSYHLLSLIEIARPRARLTEAFKAWVIPGETIRALMKRTDLVSRIHYRPSLHSEIRAELKALTPRRRELFFDLMAGKTQDNLPRLTRLDIQDQIRMTDLLLKALRFRKAAGDQDEHEGPLMDRLLVERARLPKYAADDPTLSDKATAGPESLTSTSARGGFAARDPRRYSEPPHLAHHPWRLALGGGSSPFGGYSELALRPAFHDLLNDDTGFAPHSELEIIGGSVRHYSETGRVELERFTAFKVTSLPRFESLSPSVSYVIDSGLRADLVERPGLDPFYEFLATDALLAGGLSTTDYYLYNTYLDPEARPVAERYQRVFPGFVDVQMGFTFARAYDPTWNRLRLSLLAGVRGEHAPGPVGLNRYGPAATALLTYGVGSWKFLMSTAAYGYSASGHEDSFDGRLGMSYTPMRDVELRIMAAARPDWNEATFAFSYFF